MLRIDVSKQLGEFTIEASFASEGKVTGLFGASGSGKTSLVSMIAGLLRPDRGIIAIDGETLDDTAVGVHVPGSFGCCGAQPRAFPGRVETYRIAPRRPLGGMVTMVNGESFLFLFFKKESASF